MEERMVSASQQWEDQTAEQSVRPLRLLDYIGQEDVKKNLEVFIEAAKICKTQ